MRLRHLGSTGLSVSELTLGTWGLGTGMYGRVDADEARRIILKAIDLGINAFDTADIYGRGISERILGDVLRGYDDVHVFTKVGYNMYSNEPRQRFDREYLLKAIRSSLNRLMRNWVDLIQLHNPGLRVIEDPSVKEVMNEVKNSGLAKHVGVALGPEANVLDEGLAAIKMGYEAVMFVFNALEQEPGRTLIKEAYAKGVGTIARVPHATGALSEEFALNFAEGDHRRLRDRGWLIRARSFVEERIRPIAKSLGLTLDQFAIKYVLSYPVSTLAITVTSLKELEEYAEAADGSYLKPHVIREVEDAYAEFVRLNKANGDKAH